MGIITELNYYPDRHFRYVEIREEFPCQKLEKTIEIFMQV